MTDHDKALVQAIQDRDLKKIKDLFTQTDFVLIEVGDAEASEDERSALTANVEEFDVLVVFTTEDFATTFVHKRGELFEEGEEVEGFVVEGKDIMDYLPEDYGLLINPESDLTTVIEPALLDDMRT